MKKAVYIGAGTDNKFLNTVEFDEMIAIDSQPRSEFGLMLFEGCERTNFINNLKKKYIECGFIPVLEDNHVIQFENGNQRVFFYHSISFPEDLTDEIKTKLNGYTILICDGYIPNVQILNYAAVEFDFVGSDNTVYLSDEYDDGENELYYELEKRHDMINKWIKYNCVWDEDKIEYEIINKEEVQCIKDYVTIEHAD
jgi:hypothetical protein